MSLASLMTQGGSLNNEVFSFEHAMSHRTFFGVMAPLTRFSVLPYLLDPMQRTNVAAGYFHLNHQVAHDDAMRNLPTSYNLYNYERTVTHPQPPPPAPPVPPTIYPPQIGIPGGVMVVDTDFQSESAVKWWELTNLVQHQVLTATILPQFNAQNTRWTYPFW